MLPPRRHVDAAYAAAAAITPLRFRHAVRLIFAYATLFHASDASYATIARAACYARLRAARHIIRVTRICQQAGVR